MKEKNAQKGSTMVEMIMVMALLALFGATIYMLIYSGESTQDRILQEKNAQSDARIALSYINVRLRQNDVSDKIGVEKIELTGENAIVIKERDEDYAYDTWIFCYDGKLFECFTDPDEQPTELGSFYIVDSEGVETELNDDGTITNTVYYYYRDTLTSISSTIYLRSY